MWGDLLISRLHLDDHIIAIDVRDDSDPCSNIRLPLLQNFESFMDHCGRWMFDNASHVWHRILTKCSASGLVAVFVVFAIASFKYRIPFYIF